MNTSTLAPRAAKRFARPWHPRANVSPATEPIIEQFFQDFAASAAESNSHRKPNRRETNHPSPTLGARIVMEVANRAEDLAGYHSKRDGWLPWFREIVRSDGGLAKRLQSAAEAWPGMERLIFEFYFFDGFDLADIGFITECSGDELHLHLLAVQQRLREEVILDVLGASLPQGEGKPRVPARGRGTLSLS